MLENIKLINKRERSIYCSLSEFLDDEFLYENLKSLCKKKTRYSIITRVAYRINKNDNNYYDTTTEWKSLGEQITFKFESIEDFNNHLNDYVDVVINRLSWTTEIYGLVDSEILGIQIIIHELEYSENVIKNFKFDTTSLGSHKDQINVSKIYDAFNKNIPLTFDQFGEQLSLYENEPDVINLLDGSKVNFLELINKHLSQDKKIEKMSNNIKYYQYSPEIIVTVEEAESNKRLVKVYKINGILLHKMEDIFTSQEKFTRKVGNVITYVNENGIYNKDIETKFESVYPKKISGFYSKQATHPDWRIGTLDLETYRFSKDIYKVYALGFYADKRVNTFYIEEDYNSDNLILKCLDAMLIEKYNNYTFYVHNLGGFDVVFILNVLIKAKELHPDTYDFDIFFRDNVVISINISKRYNKKKYSIKLVDSYNLLSSKLSELCETFDTEVKKSYFPYNFVTKENLFYVGDKPDYTYYSNFSSTIDIEQYKLIPKENWNTKNETLKYLEDDLISLYKVMDKFSKRVFIDYNTHITRNLTISGLAMNIFLNRYYDNNIPLINKKSIFNDIKASYFGGITEVYKPYGKNLYYYDVNSLYPYSALKPLPGLNCVYKTEINKDISDCEDLFGFFECEINAVSGYLGLLPVRTKSGVYMPLGNIKGWYFSEELKFAHQNGYEIKILKGYQFDKSYHTFDKYVKEFYNIKSTTKDNTERSIAKSLLNNLLGRFGMDLEKNVTELMSVTELSDLLQHSKVSNLLYIGDKVLVTHSNEMSSEICDSMEVDYNKTYNNLLKNKITNATFKEKTSHDISIAISAAITAYSRIFMNQTKLDILRKKGNIYYTDTDSIITDIELDSTQVGKEIGQFKLEHKILEGYFISNKTYCLITPQKIITRAKGVNQPLTVQDFKKLYEGYNVNAKRRETIKNYEIGSVNLNSVKSLLLSSNSYTKRNKIFHNNIWSDTSPILQTRTIHYTYKPSEIKLKIKLFLISFILCILILILIPVIIILIKDQHITSYEHIIKEVLDSNNINNHNTTINIKNNLHELKSNFLSKSNLVEKNSSKNLEQYLQESKIIRKIFLLHMDSLITENNKLLNQFSDAKLINKELNETIKDIKVILKFSKT